MNADTVQTVSEAVLEGVAMAAARRRRRGRREGDNKYLTGFMQEMFCVVEFAAAAALRGLQKLDLEEVPKIIRSRIFEVGGSLLLLLFFTNC